MSQDEHYELFKDLFADRPEYVENVTAEDLPPSYRVEPEDRRRRRDPPPRRPFEGQPGVREVAFAEETVDTCCGCRADSRA